MKKLFVFLFLLFFSISAYAQDKLFCNENFSLIKNAGSNDCGFLSLNNLFPANYLFFIKDRRHPRKHQTFQTLSFLKVPDRTPLSRFAIDEGGRKNWGDMYNLICGQQEDTSSEEKSESLAEGYLKRLAIRSNASRKAWGTIWLVGGGAFMISGVAALSAADDEGWWGGFWTGLYGTMALTTGAIMTGVGIYKLAITSGAERELEDVMRISDPGHRERASHEALSSLAARGRRGRILWGILWGFCSV